MESLDSILKGKPEPTNVVERPEPKAEPEVKAETPKPEETPEARAERERDEKGRFAKKQEAQTPATPDAPKAPEAPKKVETKAETTPAEKTQPVTAQDAELPPKGHVPVKVALEERRKRQQLEQELKALRAQPAQAQTSQTQDQQQQPEGMHQVEENLKANLSFAFAKRQYPDFEEVMQEWPLLIHDNPWLYKQAIADEMPAEWAYKYVKRQRLMQEIGHDPEAWRETQRKAIRGELEQEIAQKGPQQQPQRPAVPVPPPSLANAPSASTGMTSQKQWEGPTPFQNMIRR